MGKVLVDRVCIGHTSVVWGYHFASKIKYCGLNYSGSYIVVDYVFPQDYITQKGSHGKYPVKTCCISDDLSGDMLAPSWPNLA